MRELPTAREPDNIQKKVLVKFQGYDHREGAGDGAVWDMENMCLDDYPLLKTRTPRRILGAAAGADAMLALDRLYLTAGAALLVWDGETLGAAAGAPALDSSARHRLCALGKRLVIYPEGFCYDPQAGSWQSLGASVDLIGLTFRSGTYGGAEAEYNAILLPPGTGGNVGTENGVRMYRLSDSARIREGDGITISGSACPWANKTAILREIDTAEGRARLNFDVNCFLPTEALPADVTPKTEGDPARTVGWTEGTAVTLSRQVPALDFLCVNENRVWGCKGDSIYCSKLGDPFNWNVFEGISTDAWSMETGWQSGQAGDFTGCASFLGYPVFFKERRIFKVFGNKPSNFQLEPGADLGVMEGSEDSLAVAGNALFYLSPAGPVTYSGGFPADLSAPLGDCRYKNAVGGSDGRRWYVSMQDKENAWSLFVYDTQLGAWAREDSTPFTAFAFLGSVLYALTQSGDLLALRGAPPGNWTTIEPFTSRVEFQDFTAASPDKKGVGKLHLRLKLYENSSVAVSIQFDSDGVWRTVSTLTASVKRSFYLPIIPRRCDHFRVRLNGSGAWRLDSLAYEAYPGSPI